MKEYMKPEVEIISLVTDEAITIDGYGLDVSVGLDPNPFLEGQE